MSADYLFKMMLDELPQPDATLDCTGLYCPQPVIRTAARVKEMQAGQVLEVLATDPGFQIDLPAWCLSHRHEYLGMHQKGAVYVGYLRVQVDRGTLGFRNPVFLKNRVS